MAGTSATVVTEPGWAHRDEAVFTVDGDTRTWTDIVAWARRTGAWGALERDVRERLACRRHAAEAGTAAPAEEVRRAAAAFRYERGLISGEETEAWLEARHLTVAQWMQAIRDSVLCERHHPELAAIADRFPVDDDEVAAWTWPTAVCSGALLATAQDLAGRLVVLSRAERQADEDPDMVLDRFRAEVATDAAVDAIVAAHRLDWLRVEFDHAAFPSEDAAREAILCMRDDGLDLADVVAWTGGVVTAVDALREDLEPAWQAVLLGAREGDVVGPLPSADGPTVLCLRGKFVPTLADPEVVRRAEERIVARAVQHEIDARVTWHVEP